MRPSKIESYTCRDRYLTSLTDRGQLGRPPDDVMLASADHPVDALGVGLAVPFRNYDVQQFSGHLFGRVAEHLLRLGIPQSHASLLVDGDDGIVGGCEDRLEPLLGALQCLDQPAPLRHVPDDPAEEAPPVFQPRGEGQFDRELVAIPMQTEDFDGLADDPRLSRSYHPGVPILVGGTKSRGDDDPQKPAHRLLFAVAEHGRGRRVPADDVPCIVRRDDGVGGRLDDGIERPGGLGRALPDHGARF